MEIFGIIFSVPVAFVASVVYCIILVKVVRKYERTSRLLRWASAVVLAGFVVEVILLATMGAVRSRRMIGPGFYLAHSAVFFLGTPALANMFLLRRRTAFFRWSCISVVCCTMFALGLVLLQYGVSEALYGIDGTNGPFSANHSPTQAWTRPLVACGLTCA